MDEDLRAELLAMAEADQEFRHRWASLSQEEVRQELAREHARSARAAELVAKYGWPGRSLVGQDGANAAWLLIQHADHDVELQERCLELLRDAVAAGEASPPDLAYLTDRSCVNRGRNQIYGTQFHGRGETFAPCPIDDREHLDERRASAGLEPFAEYEARMHELNRRTCSDGRSARRGP
ncbi:MAG TPA: DUF6624 domain-containing protein [Gaiellaceae bacterium]|nr:DUF6624 domain-containing protein [Gaiellaceae bacterium]